MVSILATFGNFQLEDFDVEASTRSQSVKEPRARVEQRGLSTINDQRFSMDGSFTTMKFRRDAG